VWAEGSRGWLFTPTPKHHILVIHAIRTFTVLGHKKIVTEAHFNAVKLYTTSMFLELVCFWFLFQNYLCKWCIRLCWRGCEWMQVMQSLAILLMLFGNRLNTVLWENWQNVQNNVLFLTSVKLRVYNVEYIHIFLDIIIAVFNYQGNLYITCKLSVL
jgi:hypothetical protein